MNADEIRGRWIEAIWPVPGHVRALTTTRGSGEVSETPFDIGTQSPVAAQSPWQHRELLRQATTGGSGQLQWLRQVHGNRCIRATLNSCASAPEADAAWTDVPGLGLVVQTADCVPVVVAERSGEKIGAAHGGWRGLAGGVIERLIDAMGKASALVAWIGPAIGRDAYEVGEDVRMRMRSAFGAVMTDAVFTPGARPGKWQLDLHALTTRLLAAAGVSEVYGARICTFSDPRFHSYRRDGSTGRMATVVWKQADFQRVPVA